MKLLNRKLNKTHIKEIINYSKKIGITDINLDLIYAIPKETLKDLKEDLKYILSLKPTHISTYSLIIEEHTKIFIDNIKPLDEELESSMYYNIIDIER